jgi:hypothetical protein
MSDISIRYNKVSDREKVVSHLLNYPDGVKRILTMKQYEWDWIEVAERHNYPFWELLGAAIELSQEHPRRGYQADILENTRFLLMITMRLIHEDKLTVANR